MNRLKHIISACLGLLLILGTLSPVKTAAAVKPVYILAIGNSFSRDAISKLREIGLADGMDLRVATLYIGGCSLQTHWINASGNKAAYQLMTWYSTARKDYSNYSIKQALDSQSWDYVTFQQASANSGQPETFEPYLTNLSNYVKTQKPSAKQYYHQTWAYEIDSKQAAFNNYGKNQETMFTAIKNASTAAAERLNMVLIPCGEAMQKARATAPFDYANGGKSLCRDGYHPTLAQGSYLLSSVWYEVITGKSILSNTFTLSGVPEVEMNALRQSAHAAVAMYAERQLTGISIQSKPAKTAYLQNEALDTSGGALLASYSDGSKITVPMEKSMISGYNGNIAGTQMLTVTYNGKTAAFQVTVISRAAVDALINDINAIKSGTTGITQLNALKSRYDALSATEKAAVSNYSKLTGALESAGRTTVTTAKGGTSAGTSVTAGSPVSSASTGTSVTAGSSEAADFTDSSDTEADASQTAENAAVTTDTGETSADSTVAEPETGN